MVESRDRRRVFQRLFLIFAIGGLAAVAPGLALTTQNNPFDLAFAMAFAIACALALTGAWFLGARRPASTEALLPVEAALLVAFFFATRNPLAMPGVCYLCIQYRVFIGPRRQAVRITTLYIGAYLIAIALTNGASGLLQPALAIRIVAFGFGAYVVSILAVVLDRDKERGRQLRESEQRFRMVGENLREALLITDLSDSIVFANIRTRELFGYEPAELVGRKATDLLFPDARTEFEDRMHRRMTGESELYEVELVRKDGSRVFAEVSASPYRDAHGAIVGTLGAFSDISERKRLEERLRQGMRLESVGQLAGGVAHDFNNLLTVIKLNTELLLSDRSLDVPSRESLIEIQQSASRGATLTQQLLAFGRKQFLQPKRLSLAELVIGSRPMLKGLVGAQVQLKLLDDGSGAHAFADRLQIEHVLAMLVRNANEAMPRGGVVTVETRTDDVSETQAITATREMPIGRYAVLSVSDTGIGMPQEVMTRLFEPFVTTKAAGEGTGLGLASMYGLVRQSGGYVDVESAPGAGTTVRIYLPLAEQVTAMPRPVLQPV